MQPGCSFLPQVLGVWGWGGRGVEVGGGVRLTLDWLRWCTIHGIFRDPRDEFEPQLLRVTEARIRIPSNNPY